MAGILDISLAGMSGTKKDYFFHQDNTSGKNVVTLKIVGLTGDQYQSLKEFVEKLANE